MAIAKQPIGLREIGGYAWLFTVQGDAFIVTGGKVAFRQAKDYLENDRRYAGSTIHIRQLVR